MANKKMVAIVVNDATEPPPIEVIPPRITLDGGEDDDKRQHLTFIVINNRDEDISNVKVTFPEGAKPFQGNDQFFDTGGIDSGDSDNTQRRKADKHPKGDHPYKYTVTVTLATGTSPPPLDPQVVITNGGHLHLPKRGKKKETGKTKKPKARKTSKK